jgi:hypothetical protein
MKTKAPVRRRPVRRRELPDPPYPPVNFTIEQLDAAIARVRGMRQRGEPLAQGEIVIKTH